MHKNSQKNPSETIMLIFFACIGVLIWFLSDKLHVSFIITFLIIFPLAFFLATIGMIIAAVNNNFRPDITLDPVNPEMYPDRIASLEPDTAMLADRGFDKVDEFFIQISPPTLVYVFKHRNEPVFLYLYHLGVKKGYDIISFMGEERGMTTTGSEGSGIFPKRPDGRMLQIFLNASLDTLISEHLRALGFVRSRGCVPEDASTETVRRRFLEYLVRSGKEIKSIPVWPVMFLIWNFTKPGLKVYGFPIEEQFKRGTVKFQ